MSSVAIFLVLLIFLTLLQMTFWPVAFGLIAILIWYLLKGFQYTLFYIFIFSIMIGLIANIPIWIVFLATVVSFYLFVGARQVLPARFVTSVVLILASIFTWEISTLFFTRLFSVWKEEFSKNLELSLVRAWKPEKNVRGSLQRRICKKQIFGLE